MGLRDRLSIRAQVLAGVSIFMLLAAPALAEQPGGEHNFQLKSAPRIMVEWFGVNIGGGYINNTMSFIKIDATFFTISQENWYYTIFEGELNPEFGMIGVGGRAGYQKFFTDIMALRVGMKLGFSRWLRDEPANGHSGWVNGAEVAPHIQLNWMLRHSSVGIGIDFPIMIAVEGGEWGRDSRDISDVDVGTMLYFRWSVY